MTDTFQVGNAEIEHAEATRVAEQTACLRDGRHYWIFSLIFGVGEGVDQVVLDHTHLRGATAVHCANCGAREQDGSACPGM